MKGNTTSTSWLPKRVSPGSLNSSVGHSVQRGLCIMLLLLAGHLAQAQLYILTSNSANNFQNLLLTPTNSLTNLATWPRTSNGGSGAPVICGVGNYMYVGQTNSNTLTRYDIALNTWATLGNTMPAQGADLVTDGTNLYQRLGTNALTAAGVSLYNPGTDTWSTVTALANVNQIISAVGSVYVLQSNFLKRYDPGAGALVQLAAKPAAVPNNPFSCADANKVFCTANVSGAAALHVYTISTNTWSTETSTPTNFPNGFASDGTYLYGKNGATIYRYLIGSNGAWVNTGLTAFTGGSTPTASLAGSYYAAAAPACAAPVVTATLSQATCTGSTANSNGTITLTAFDANAQKVHYTIGSTYTGAGFASATTLSGPAPYTVVSSLANPTVNQPYTIRVFCDATTYTDKTVILAPKQCQTADLSLSVSPATQTGNAGEFLTYTVTLTNGGPSTATNVVVDVPMPDPKASLLSAAAASGSYSSVTKEWVIPSLPVGSTTLTFTVKVN
ncbi:hypothetical protein [Fibrella arboris]|uniref:hypothetical protein n=1 Tax=Fibrella arboris TaxID=3242486 RepID=UPI003522F2A8